MTFNESDHSVLARGILARWNYDLPAAACAWRRLFQNNCTDQQFKKLVDNQTNNIPSWVK